MMLPLNKSTTEIRALVCSLVFASHLRAGAALSNISQSILNEGGPPKTHQARLRSTQIAPIEVTGPRCCRRISPSWIATQFFHCYFETTTLIIVQNCQLLFPDKAVNRKIISN